MTTSFRTVTVQDQIPDPAHMDPGVFYSWEDDTVGFLCPCGCGEDVVLPVTPDREEANRHKHMWFFDPARSTLSPSVSHRAGCRSHYTITDGNLLDHGPNQ